LFAHRGLSAEAPENTMAAFQLAKNYGIPGIELDVHLSADNRLVIIHDFNSARVVPGTNLDIQTSTWEQLKILDAGSWKDSKYRGVGIPLLSDLLETYGKDFYFDIEMKSPQRVPGMLEQSLARLLADMHFGADRIMVSSFDPRMIGRFKAVCPGIPTAIIYSRAKDVPWYLRHGEGRWIGQADVLKPRFNIPGPLGLAWGKRTGGRQVVPWTVDDPAVARRLLDIGCTGIISNKPHLLGLGAGTPDSHVTDRKD